MAVADLGEGPGGAVPPLIFFNFKTKLRPEGPKKIFLETAPPPPLSEGLDDLPPSHLKVWICHCMVQFVSKEVMSNDAPYSM